MTIQTIDGKRVRRAAPNRRERLARVQLREAIAEARSFGAQRVSA